MNLAMNLGMCIKRLLIPRTVRCSFLVQASSSFVRSSLNLSSRHFWIDFALSWMQGNPGHFKMYAGTTFHISWISFHLSAGSMSMSGVPC